ncbi:family 78 glycoside hydrolase catalytic domain [Sphingobacterium faecium]|jgi:alpha-L-rhamnosidase|uniref:family 78 glycoside hydrolase catalytic domain n=1 Tax=Sphingobacterium faecium TaxID=34087 RepID=UPI00320B1A0B
MIINKSYFFLWFLCTLSLVTWGKKKPITIFDLRCENLINPLAIDNQHPHLSWKITAPEVTMKQRYFQIQVASDSTSLAKKNLADRWDSGKIQSSASIMIPYSGQELRPRTQSYWRVRVWNEKNQASAWSPINRFGIGIIADDKLQGQFIGLSGIQSPLLRKQFKLTKLSPTLIHINALGYYELYVNGKKVSTDILAPAVSHLDKRSLITTYDIKPYLQIGDNSVVLWLGTAWFKPTTGFNVKFNGAVVRAQIDILNHKEWTTIIKTDNSWEASASGYRDTGSWNALAFGGERIDANLNPSDMATNTLNKRKWIPAEQVAIPAGLATPQMNEPNKIQATQIAKNIKPLEASSWLIDMGKALNGWFEIKLTGLLPNQEIKVEYSDHLDQQGNFQDQGQSDTYIASGKPEEVFINKFNHHAFQYVRISNVQTAPHLPNIRGYLIHTDFRTTSSFSCSDTDLNAIHDMIQYTMRNLSFGGYQVDCPHLERAGYGGDGNSSTNTFQTMFDVSPLFNNWIQAWSDSMREGGSLPHVAPNPGAGGGGPYWCGFFVMAPWRTHVNYADSRLIKRYYEEMKMWMGYVDKHTVDGLLKRWPDTKYRDWFLGDWLAPAGVDAGNQMSVDLVNNCFISECLGTMEKIARFLNKPTEAASFADRKNKLNTLLHKTFFNSTTNSYATGSQLDMSYPMLVGATPIDKMETVKTKLMELTAEKHQNHIAVGLVGVPILTQWAVDQKATDFMYTMLKKRDYPGYLHMIDNGASTTWEYWSGERSRIHNCYNGIGTWFYQAVAGIRPDENYPGYQHVNIMPQIPTGVTWTKSHVDSPYGKIAVNWYINKDKLTVEIEIPIGSSATFTAPDNTIIIKCNGKKVQDAKTLDLTNGTHRVELKI